MVGGEYKLKVIKQCKTCGKDFMLKQNHPRYVYCSNLCRSRDLDRKKYIKKWKKDNVEKVKESQRRCTANRTKRRREDSVYREKINKQNRERVAFKKETIPGFREEAASKNAAWRLKVGLQHFRNYEKEKSKIPGWREKRREQTKQSRLKRFEKNPEGEKLKESLQRKEWYSKNKEKRKVQIKKYRSTLPPGTIAQWSKKWAKRNPDKRKAIGAAYRAAKFKATPPWQTHEDRRKIQELFSTCPKQHELDHIYPLQGMNFCGLHVPWNLEHLESKKNKGKCNRIDNEYFKEVLKKSNQRWGFPEHWGFSDGGFVS